MAPRMDQVVGIDAFPHQILGSMMTATENEIQIKFLKMKPPTFQGIKSEDGWEFIID